MKFYLWNKFSEGGTALAKALNAKRIKHEGKPIRVDVLVNWGASNIARDTRAGKVLNTPDAVKRTSNKLEAFRAMYGKVGIPEWTESLAEASEWLKQGHMVVCRTVLNGHSGNGTCLVLERHQEPSPFSSRLKITIPSPPTEFQRPVTEQGIEIYGSVADVISVEQLEVFCLDNIIQKFTKPFSI